MACLTLFQYGQRLAPGRGWCCLLVILIFYVKSGSCANDFKDVIDVHKQSSTSILELSAKEKKWLSNHKKIRIGYDGSLPPYSFVNDQGKMDGIAVEIMDILGDRLGATFTVYPDSNWNTLYRAAARRKVDVIAAMVNRPDRVKWFNFTKPYLTKSLVIVTRQDNTAIKARSDLANTRIAVVKGYRYVDQIGAEFPAATVIKLNGMLDSLQQVIDGKVDAAVLFLGTANYLQAKHQLTQLKIADFYERNSADESIAVRKDWPILVGILQKGLDSLTDDEINKIFTKWVVQGGVDVIEPVAKPIMEPSAQVEKQPVNQSETKPQAAITDQQPKAEDKPLASIAKASPEMLEIGRMVIVFLVVLALFLLWFAQHHKQKRLRMSRSELSGQSRYLQDDESMGFDLPIVPMFEKEAVVEDGMSAMPAEESGLEPEPEPSSAEPIALDAHKLVQDKMPEVFSNEQIHYQRDENGEFNFIGSAISHVLGYSEVEFMSNYRRYLTDNPANQAFDDLVEASIQGQPDPVCVVEILDKAGEAHWLKVTATAIYDGLGHCIGIQGFMQDITNEKLFGKLADQTQKAEPPAPAKPSLAQSFHDSIQEAIHWAEKGDNEFAVVFLALDRLRYLDGEEVDAPPNDVLNEARKRLKSALRDSDSIVEMAADRFALVLPNTSDHAAALIGEKIRKILQVPYLVGIKSIVMDTAIGFAAYPKHGRDAESLLRKAQVTSAQPNPVEVTEPKKPATATLTEDASLQLQQDLVNALDECKVALRSTSQNNVDMLNRHSQFVLHYQSRHSLEDYSITGFEALIRWWHPDLGLLLPRDFVNLVKDIGLLDVMTYWIIQQVSFQAVDWVKKGVEAGILTVNLGNLSIKQAVDIDKVIAIVKETGAKPEWLMFSIHEHDLIQQTELVSGVVKRLTQAGFQVSIDNVSSSAVLTDLQQLPVQVVEIAPSLLRYGSGLVEDDEVAKLLPGLREFSKTILAKEVESEGQLDFLRNTGCDLIQGHLLSRPLPAKEARELLENLPDFAWYLQQ